MTEIWRKIPKYPYLEASNLGRVRSTDREELTKRGLKTLVKGQILATRIDRGGYLRLRWTYKNKKINASVHRLIAEAFIPNLSNKPYINHKDSNRTNNNVTNLEWCTPKENYWHARMIGRINK